MDNFFSDNGNQNQNNQVVNQPSVASEGLSPNENQRQGNFSNQQNVNFSNNNFSKAKKPGFLKIMGIVLLVVIVISLFSKCGNSNSSMNGKKVDINQPVAATFTAKELANDETDIYKKYINKKVTISGLSVSAKDGSTLIKLPSMLMFYVSCDNVDSLNLKDGDNVTVTGIILDSTYTNYDLKMTSCSVSKN